MQLQYPRDRQHHTAVDGTGADAARQLARCGLLVCCWAAVLGLEPDIRLSGGSGSVIARALPAYQLAARRLLLVHISAAVATYLLWSGLALVSLRRFRRQLPGPFSRLHRRLGWCVFGGLLFTAVSATGMYLLTFVL